MESTVDFHPRLKPAQFSTSIPPAISVPSRATFTISSGTIHQAFLFLQVCISVDFSQFGSSDACCQINWISPASTPCHVSSAWYVHAHHYDHQAHLLLLLLSLFSLINFLLGLAVVGSLPVSATVTSAPLPCRVRVCDVTHATCVQPSNSTFIDFAQRT